MSLVMLGAAKKGDKGRPESDFSNVNIVSLLQRFTTKIEKDVEGCWNWTGIF